MIGSSNVSSNGLSFEGAEALGWDEANVVSQDPELLSAARNWVSGLPVCGVTPADLRAAEIAWERRRQAMTTTRGRLSISQVLEGGPASVAGRGVYVTLTTGEWSNEATIAVAEASKEYPTIDAWEDWPQLPREGVFISFSDTETPGRFVFDGCFYRNPKVPDRAPGKDRFSLQWCFPTEMPLGLKSARRDIKAWGEVIALILKDRSYDGAEYISLEELAGLFAQGSGV